MTLIFLDGRGVLHIVDIAINFYVESFLDSAGETYGQIGKEIEKDFLNS